MRPTKTDLARQTLQAHTGALGMRERRALILCDGQRDLAELVRLLGQDAPLLVQRLVSTGYLAIFSTQQPLQPPPPSGAMPVTASTGTRRSLVAAKLYLSGMLELQRDPEAARHRDRLQTRLDDERLLDALADAYRFLEGHVAPTLAGRIRDRLFEALPHAPLRRMQALLDARADAPLS